MKNKRMEKFIRATHFVLLIAMGIAVMNVSEAEAAKKILPKKIKLRGVSAEKTGICVKVNEKEKILYTVTPKKATNKKVVFSSSNKKVAKVTSKGVVKGVKEGTATITLRAKAKKTVKAKVKVTVSQEVVKNTTSVKSYQSSAPIVAPVGIEYVESQVTAYLASNTNTGALTEIVLSMTELEIPAGESYQLNANLVPATADAKISWSVSPRGGINVYSNGGIYVTEDTPIGTEAIITAQSGSISATCKVTVVQGLCEHDWDYDEDEDWAIVQAPECMVEGVERSTCTKCQKIRERAVPALGHKWGIGRTITEPTCVEAGEKEETCQNTGCGETRIVVVKPNGHTWVTAGTVVEEPTCAKAGKKEFTCISSGCEVIKVEAIPAVGHTWNAGEITKSPTCTTKGSRSYQCVIEGCGGTKKETIPAIGHTWTYGEITRQPTCTVDGIREMTCETCGDTDKEKLPKLGHDDDAGVVTQEATCEDAGHTSYTCNRCSRVRVDRKTPAALGHNYPDAANEANWTVDKAPTCLKDGIKSLHCTNTWHDENGEVVSCSSREEITEVARLGHDTVETVIQKQSCVLPEITQTTCKRVNGTVACTYKVKEETKPIAGHNWGDANNPVYTVDREPTCKKMGRESIHCTNVWDGVACTERKGGRGIDALNHENWTNTQITKKVDATCTQDGYAVHKCLVEYNVDGVATVCGEIKTITLPALGHVYEDFTTNIEPTCTTAGEKSKHCVNTWTDEDGNSVQCDKESVITPIEPLPHNWSGWTEKQAPTHDELGYEEKTCPDCGAVQQRSLSGGHGYDASGNCQASGCGRSLSLTEVTVDDWEYVLDDTEQTILLKKYIGTNDSIKIPAQMSVTTDEGTKTYDVTFAGDYEARTQVGVFASNSKCNIRAVSFDDGVKMTNMKYMFYGCETLEAVLNIPSGVTNMYGTFKGCTSLVTVSALPSGLTELTSTFQDCKKLSEAPVIPAAVTNMYATFKNCEMLTEAPVLPPMVTNLDWTFSGCTGISVAPSLPVTVTEMTNTFENSGLLEVPTDIPAGVTKLTMTFYGCAQLDRVTSIPTSIKTMEYTFKNCKNLVYAAPIPDTVEDQLDVFVGCDKLGG